MFEEAAQQMASAMDQAVETGVHTFPGYRIMVMMRDQLVGLGMDKGFANQVATKIKYNVDEAIDEPEGQTCLISFAKLIYATWLKFREDFSDPPLTSAFVCFLQSLETVNFSLTIGA